VVNSAPIDVERLRRTFEDDDVVAELYAMYVQDTSQRISELRAALEAGEAAKINRTGHTLKGSSANIGANGMRTVAAALEAADVEKENERVSTLVDDLEHEFARVERFINEFIERAHTLT
jgi:HPt (histidine-containing phosphotransfer) domain-containing protein